MGTSNKFSLPQNSYDTKWKYNVFCKRSILQKNLSNSELHNLEFSPIKDNLKNKVFGVIVLIRFHKEQCMIVILNHHEECCINLLLTSCSQTLKFDTNFLYFELLQAQND